MRDLNNKKWGHKWGYADTEFVVHPEDRSVSVTGSRYPISGYRMYGMIPFFESFLGFKLDLNDLLEEKIESLPISYKNQNFLDSIEAHFEGRKYSFDDSVRRIHSHGQTSVDEVVRVLYDKLDKYVDMVFFCESEEDVQKLIKLAHEHDVCLVPYGGGTNVTNALKLPSNENRMIVSANMQRMNKIEWIDKENLLICVQAGITGGDLEKQLAKEGYTTGHEPDSVELSTLGGWIATNASGMKRGKYGNIEDIVDNITLITPQGTLEEKSVHSRSSAGMRLNSFLFGNEGNLGIIVKAVLKIHTISEELSHQSIIFPNFQLGHAFMKALYKKGNIPASIRLMDNLQFQFGRTLRAKPSIIGKVKNFIGNFMLFKLKKMNKKEIAVATILMEGTTRDVCHQEKEILKLADQFNGVKGGRKNGERGYLLTFGIAYIRELLLKLHIIAESFEATVPWDKIDVVYDAVRSNAKNKQNEYNLPGKPLLCARITQIYHSGVCMYFTYGIYRKNVENALKIFIEIEHSFREVILENGGSISHHHGVGKIRKDFIPKVFSRSSIDAIKGFKKSLDPKNVFGIQNNAIADLNA